MNFLEFLRHNRAQVFELTLEHLWLVGASTLLAVLVGIPLGILVARRPSLNTYPSPRTVWMNRGSSGSFSIFLRSRRI